jgi:hypothetical protein
MEVKEVNELIKNGSVYSHITPAPAIAESYRVLHNLNTLNKLDPTEFLVLLEKFLHLLTHLGG